MAGVRFEGVWKLFGTTVAVRDLDLEVRDGEFLVLVGPSGCGKTTSLRMLGGLEVPSYGRVWIDERDVTLMPPGKRDVAMVFQSYALYPHLSVYRNLAFGPSVRHESKRELRARVQEVAETLGIQELLQRRPSELSGGQRQRVALGRALIRRPQLFLLDEPLSNLDAALRVQMRTELVRLHSQFKVTTVYVTHDQVEALTMGDRVAVFNTGSLLQVGTPNQLYENPANLFVAGFIGSPKMNFFPGKISQISARGVLVACLDHQVLIEGTGLAPGAEVGTEVTVGLRPHDLHWLDESPARCTERLEVSVGVVEHSGSEIFVEASSAAAERLMARFPRSAPVAPGNEVVLAFDPSDLHLFSQETEESILARSVLRGTERTREGTAGAGPEKPDAKVLADLDRGRGVP